MLTRLGHILVRIFWFCVLYGVLPLARLIYYIWSHRQHIINTAHRGITTAATLMAPRRKQNGAEQDAANLVAILESDIRAVEREIKMARRRLEKTITDIRLQVVGYKSELGPELLRSNLYELMQRENRLLFVNRLDHYLDMINKSRHVGFRNEVDKYSFAEQSVNQQSAISVENSASINSTPPLSVQNDSTGSSAKTTDSEAATNNDEIRDEITLANEDVDAKENVKSFDQKKDAKMVNSECEIEEIMKGSSESCLDGILNVETDDANDERKNTLSEKLTDVRLEKANNSSHNVQTKSDKFDNQMRKENIPNVITIPIPEGNQTIKSPNFLFQACIEQSVNAMGSLSFNENTTKSMGKLTKWQENYDNYNQGKLLASANENCNELTRAFCRRNNSGPLGNVFNDKVNVNKGFNDQMNVNKGLNDQMNVNKGLNDQNSKHIEDNLVDNILKHTNEAKTMNVDQRVENMLCLVDNKENRKTAINNGNSQALKTPLQGRTTHGGLSATKKPTTQGKTSGQSRNYLVKSKFNTSIARNQTGSSSKGILRPSKLGAPVENMTKGLSTTVNSVNLTKSAHGVHKIYQKSNEHFLAGMTTNRVCTPRKQEQSRPHSEQRSDSRSRIPKFVYSSPVPKSSRTPANRNVDWAARSLSCPKQTLTQNKRLDWGSSHIYKPGKKRSSAENASAAKGGQTKAGTCQKITTPCTVPQRQNLPKNTGENTKFINNQESVPNSVKSVGETKEFFENAAISPLSSPPDNIICEHTSPVTDSSAPRESVSVSVHGSPDEIVTPPDVTNCPDVLIHLNTTSASMHADKSCLFEKGNETDPKATIDKANHFHRPSKPVTVPEDLYILRQDIPNSNRGKPINFIKRNKERLKKMAPKNRRKKSKNRGADGIQMFRNSIVIDSRYLMIVNRILEENRACTCRRENGVFKNKPPCLANKDRLNKASQPAPVSDTNIYVKFSNFQQLHTALSRETPTLSANELEDTPKSNGERKSNTSQKPNKLNVGRDISEEYRARKDRSVKDDRTSDQKALRCHEPHESWSNPKYDTSNNVQPSDQSNQSENTHQSCFKDISCSKNAFDIQSNQLSHSQHSSCSNDLGRSNAFKVQSNESKSPSKASRDSVEIVQPEPARSARSQCSSQGGVSQGSVTGSSLLSCFKTDSSWIARYRNERYPSLDCLTDSRANSSVKSTDNQRRDPVKFGTDNEMKGSVKSGMDDNESQGPGKSTFSVQPMPVDRANHGIEVVNDFMRPTNDIVDSGRQNTKVNNATGRSLEAIEPNKTIDIDEKSVEHQEKSSQCMMRPTTSPSFLSYVRNQAFPGTESSGTNIISNGEKLMEGEKMENTSYDIDSVEAELNDLSMNKESMVDTRTGERDQQEANITGDVKLQVPENDTNANDLHTKPDNLKDLHAKPDVGYTQGNSTVELDSRSIETHSFRTPNTQYHENSSDIIKSHKTINKFVVSSIEKSDEIYVDTPEEAKTKKKHDTNREGEQSTRNKSNTNAKNGSQQNFTKRNNKRDQDQYNKSIRNQSSHTDTSVEVISHIRAIKEEMEDLSFLPIGSHDGRGNSVTTPAMRTIEPRSPNNTETKKMGQPLLQVIKLEPNIVERSPILLTDYSQSPSNTNEFSSIEYLETKETMANVPNIGSDRPITLVPIENLLSSQYKFTQTQPASEGNSPIDLTTGMRTKMEFQPSGLGSVFSATYSEFEPSLDQAFSSTRHEISTQTGTSYTPKYPRKTLSFRDTPVGKTPKETPKIRKNPPKETPKFRKTPAKETLGVRKTPGKDISRTTWRSQAKETPGRETPAKIPVKTPKTAKNMKPSTSRLLLKSPKLRVQSPGRMSSRAFLASSTPIHPTISARRCVKEEPL
ncbi:hypothetical protein M8J77_011778 [Diaphorina citri]|nr:hypothetical protein M8J77_011778 [Diaphorina citri]